MNTGMISLFTEEQGYRKRSFVMKNLMHKEGREIEIKTQAFQGPGKFSLEKYKRLIADERYLDHAISKIATDLSHYLTK